MSRIMSLVERRFQAFLRTPLSVRNAMAVIVSATLVSVVAGGVLITVVDGDEFPDIGTGLWWALQTVTTVGYGDVTPEDHWGRLVGAFIMLESIAFVAIVTAAINTSVVERARREHAQAAAADAAGAPARVLEELAEVRRALEELQGLVREGSVPSGPSAPREG